MFGRFDYSRWSPSRQATCVVLSLLTLSAYVSQWFDSRPDELSFGQALSVVGTIYFVCAVALRDQTDPPAADGASVVGHRTRIEQLQQEISDAAFYQSSAERRGDSGNAAYWRGRILQLESELRRLGA